MGEEGQKTGDVTSGVRDLEDATLPGVKMGGHEPKKAGGFWKPEKARIQVIPSGQPFRLLILTIMRVNLYVKTLSLR